MAVKRPMLPAVLVRGSRMLPMEFCVIAVGNHKKKFRGYQRTQLVNINKRADKKEGLKELLASEEAFPESSVRVSREFYTTDARILMPPTLAYGNGDQVHPIDGRWSVQHKQMVEGGKVAFWTCVSFAEVNPLGFSTKLMEVCETQGMKISREPLIPCIQADPTDPKKIEETLLDIHKDSAQKLLQFGIQNGKLQLLIVILPDIDRYGEIKKVLDMDVGIVSPCCRAETASRSAYYHLEHLAMQINVKVGGTNTKVVIPDEPNENSICTGPTIVFGSDLTHLAGSSIAAVVASMNWPGMKNYKGLVSALKTKTEIIEEEKLHSMVSKLLRQFQQSTGSEPVRLIFYRDGVCPTMYTEVLSVELLAVKKACQEVFHRHIPITFLVATKRCQLRFFDTAFSGIVVDKDIFRENYPTFFLSSQPPPVKGTGTSCPMRYTVLHDDNELDLEKIEYFTYDLCHTNVRENHTVRVVPPVTYADALAMRSRYYVTEGVAAEDLSTKPIDFPMFFI